MINNLRIINYETNVNAIPPIKNIGISADASQDNPRIINCANKIILKSSLSKKMPVQMKTLHCCFLR